MEEELKILLQNTGDGIATLFEQMLKGEWKDENGHDVKLNAAMWNMRDVLRDIMAFRAKHLGYTAPATGG